MAATREALREAFPAGYVAIRGTSTVEGWTCIRANDDEVEWVRRRNGVLESWLFVVAQGQWFRSGVDGGIQSSSGWSVETEAQRAAREAGALLADGDDMATWRLIGSMLDNILAERAW